MRNWHGSTTQKLFENRRFPMTRPSFFAGNTSSRIRTSIAVTLFNSTCSMCSVGTVFSKVCIRSPGRWHAISPPYNAKFNTAIYRIAVRRPPFSSKDPVLWAIDRRFPNAKLYYHSASSSRLDSTHTNRASQSGEICITF